MKKIIEYNLLVFGFLPMLTAIESLEFEDDFETCQLIIDVLNEMSYKKGIKLPTKFSEDAIAEMKIAFMVNFGLSGDIAFKNNWWYAEQILLSIRKFKSEQKS